MEYFSMTTWVLFYIYEYCQRQIGVFTLITFIHFRKQNATHEKDFGLKTRETASPQNQ